MQQQSVWDQFLGGTSPQDTNPAAPNVWDQFLGAPSQDSATLQAVHAGADPADLAEARTHLGKKEYQNYCQAFVEHATGGSKRYYSAIDAWNAQKDRQLPGALFAQPGDMVYFSPVKGNPYGHTGIYSGSDKFISATPGGVEELPIDEWEKKTGETLLGTLPYNR